MNLLKDNEIGANIASAKVMRLTSIVLTAVLILNIVGIFIVDMTQMVICYIAGMVLMFVPTLVVNVMKKRSEGYVKYVIITCAVIFTGILSVILPKHVVLLYVYPIAISSLYFSGKLNVFSTAFTIVAVSAAQVISFYIPCDKDANFTTFKSVILYGIVPRAMILFAISMIFTMLCKRTASMLGNLMSAEQQEQLRAKSAEISETLVKAVQEMDGITADSANSGRMMAARSEDVMRDSEENSEHIRSIEGNMTAISDNLRSLDEMSREIELLLQRSNEITAENNTSLSVAEDGMKQIYKYTDTSMKTISELSEQSRRILDIVQMIGDISRQTNILSINASIESAHAGEAGRGFSIVAEEMVTLSNQTKDSAQEIGNIIADFTKNIKNAVGSMEQNFSLTQEGMENMNRIKSSAEKLSDSNNEISQNIGRIADVISDVAKSGNDVSTMLSEVSRNIENNSMAVTSVSDTIRKTSENIETLNTMVKEIRGLSEQLDTLAK